MTSPESTLRQHPDTLQLADRLPDWFVQHGEGQDRRWLTYQLTAEAGLTVLLLSDEDVAGWTPVAVVPA